MKITTGCAGSSIKEFAHRLAPNELERLYADFAANREDADARHRFVHKIVGAHSDYGEAGTYEES